MTLYDGWTGAIIREDAPTKRPTRFRRRTPVKVFHDGTPPVPAPSLRPRGVPPSSSALILGRLARQAAGDPARFLRLLMRHLAREIGRRMG